MRTIYIMVEGPTEEEFVNNSISHYLKAFGILNAVPIQLETSPGFYGGDITFDRYQSNAQKLLASDPNGIVTSLIDYHELRVDFPGHAAAMAMTDKNASVTYVEQQVYISIGNNRLIPYIQLFEFEGLLFSDIKGFNYIPRADIGKAQYVINHYPNPELINGNPSNVPSKRLKGIIPRYKKTFHGPLIALDNGMPPVLAKCPRFKNWIDTIIARAITP